MDAGADERARTALPGRLKRRRPAALAGRGLLFAAAAACLLAGIAGGLLRAGVPLPALHGAAWPAQAALTHAALMIGGFLGSVIGIERAVAVRRLPAYAAPLASGLGGLCLVAGAGRAGAWLLVLAALLFCAVGVAVVRRQRATHNVVLLTGALAWLAGNLLYATGADKAGVLPWWFAFPVLTIAAERLEMTRLMRHHRAAAPALFGVLAALLLGAALAAWQPLAGGLLYGAALLLLALWLGRFDIARRTVFAHGLSRYMACCLLAGYAWLGIGGLAWAATALGWPLRDAALHALGLGFIVSMVMGHAPVVLAAVARVQLRFGKGFYLPPAALHLSLVVRLAIARDSGAAFNAAALALFALNMVGAALAPPAIGDTARPGAVRPDGKRR